MRTIVYFILTSISFSCGHLTETPIITDPQPDNGIDLKEIPRKLLGTYRSLADSIDTIHLIITDKEIIIKVVRNPNASLAALDSNERQNLKDTVYQEGNDSMKVRVTADSIFRHSVHFDTIYYSNDKYLIKKAKGYYFFNQRFRDKWVVRTLRIADNAVLISKLRSKEEVSGLNDYSSVEPDSIIYIPLSAERICTLLNDERFGDELIFVRIEYGLQR